MRVATLSLALAGVPLVSGLPQLSTASTPHPVAPSRHAVSFPSVAAPRAQARTVGPAPQAASPAPVTSTEVTAPAQDVPGGVAVVGVTWPDSSSVSATDQFQIRTLTDKGWGGWEQLDRDSSHGPDGAEAKAAAAAAEHGTQPYVVAGATKFEVRAVFPDGSEPTSASVQVVDPGTSTADATVATSQPGAAAAAGARPTIYTRAQWGADESLRRAAPDYGQVQVAYVHHTDSSNNYTAAQVPAIIRGIYAYHVQGEGWNDIGYNFLVDRFGRIWEGRYGGVDRPVVGAHTLNYNSWSTGASGIGNFVSTAPPQAMVDAFKRLFAWKLGISGIPATGTVFARDKWFNRISGHRDAFQTTCPGQLLYNRLSEIRSGTAALEGYLAPATTGRDWDRNGSAELLSYPGTTSPDVVSGPVSVLWSAPRQPVENGVAIGSGWNALRNATLTPDLTGDGKPDIVAQDPRNNLLRVYSGDGTGGFAGVAYRGKGWNAITRIVAAGDRDGDGHNDLLATNTNGDLILYRGDGAGWVVGGQVIGRGWNSIGSITSAGDLNGDHIPDLLATRKSDGAQLMYAGRSDGTTANGVVWGTGWGSLSPVIGGADLDKDGQPDLFAREPGGVMRTYYADGSGRSVRMNRWGAGWNGLNQMSTGVDWDGDGNADIVANASGTAGGQLRLYAGRGTRDFMKATASVPSIPGADLVRMVGDVNGDGYPDAIARVGTDDTLDLMLGQSNGTFGAPRVIGNGWEAFDLVEPAADLDYDGVPDLLARDASGNLLLYPFHRDGSFGPRVTLGVGWQGMASVVGVGAFNNDANGDVVALRASDHALVLYRGDGATALQDSFVMATGQDDLVQLVGVSDYNGDGAADLIARSANGDLWLYTGNGAGGLNPGRQPLHGGEGAGHVIG
ncbi:FG-GAP-like repeat-containing protein [Oryzihumus leptocrescens]|uniref:FG-GAP-like repeat-containing protein n=1 Tax=Oryzihumus leptocrescens TaxID=297536 RepID=UPI00114EF462|nr:FG-GAP-like repeat-containing protein [Oryzihumus leptocrescens]